MERGPVPVGRLAGCSPRVAEQEKVSTRHKPALFIPSLRGSLGLLGRRPAPRFIAKDLPNAVQTAWAGCGSTEVSSAQPLANIHSKTLSPDPAGRLETR